MSQKRRPDCYVIDREYDSEAIHRLIQEDMNAYSITPVRSWDSDFVGGTYCQEMAYMFDGVR